ncbi:MAG: ATP-binding cassette domain-containing protein [Nitrospirae bacterium]|nr:ATP-binding cassette domain-containing protein [Nitrospirota bacterium]
MEAVRVKELRKSYNTFPALDGINFTIRKGEVFGLLGPNGAGKTTTIRILSGLTRPSSGTATIMGYDVMNNPVMVKKSIGVVPETSNLYPELTCFDNLVFAGRLYGMSTRNIKTKSKELLYMFGLQEKSDVPFGKLSSGMKRKLTVAASLIHDPPVLFLDEPTTGLDVMSARSLREIIQSLKNRGITILLTTHYIEEADRLCDRIAIIVRGKIITIDTPEALKKSVGIEKAFDVKIISHADFIEKEFSKITTAFRYEKKEDVFRFFINDLEAFIKEFSDFIKDNNLQIESINTVTPSLEDAFVEITGLKRETMVQEKGSGK